MNNIYFVTAILIAACLACSGTSTSKADWPTAKRIAGKEKGLSHISCIAIDDNFAYVVVGGTVADKNAGTSGLRRVDLATGDVAVLDNGDRFPQSEQGGIAIDDKFVYWNAGGNILRVSKSGGKADAIATENVGIGIDMAVDKEKVYWTNHGYYVSGQPATPMPIYAAPIGGGKTEIVAEGQMVPGNIVLDDKFIYWRVSSGINKRAKAGGEVQSVLAIDEKEGIDELVSHANDLYYGFREAGGSRWSLKKVPKSGGGTTTVAKTFSLKQFVVDDKSIYFFDEEGMSDDVLCRVPISGGEVVRVDHGYASGSMALGKTNIFFASLDDIYSITK